MKVTLSTILKGEDYAPVPGTEYELAEGHTVRLKRPYIDLQERFEDLEDEADEAVSPLREKLRQLREKYDVSKEELEAGRRPPQVDEEDVQQFAQLGRKLQKKGREYDVKLAKLATEGTWPERYQQAVAARIAADFRRACSGISTAQASS